MGKFFPKIPFPYGEKVRVRGKFRKKTKLLPINEHLVS